MNPVVCLVCSIKLARLETEMLVFSLNVLNIYVCNRKPFPEVQEKAKRP